MDWCGCWLRVLVIPPASALKYNRGMATMTIGPQCWMYSSHASSRCKRMITYVEITEGLSVGCRWSMFQSSPSESIICVCIGVKHENRQGTAGSLVHISAPTHVRDLHGRYYRRGYGKGRASNTGGTVKVSELHRVIRPLYRLHLR